MDKIRSHLLRNERGVALLMALFTVTLIIFLAVEVSYETAVEYRVAASDYHRLKAYYAAKSGVELSLLRIQLYRNVVQQYGNQQGAQQYIDLLWQFPFTWPPTVPDAATGATKDDIQSSVKDSLMDATYLATIESEGAKIDINDLASPSEALRNATRKQLQTLLENRLAQDDDWARENSDLNIEELINNLTDWIDSDAAGVDGGDEKSVYSDSPITNGQNSDFIPPNSPFKTMQELMMVKGMTEELYQILLPSITVYGVKGINVNYSDKKTLQSIDPQITEEIADDIIKRRTDPQAGPFADEKSFQDYLRGQGIDLDRFNESQIPLYFNAEYNFRIKSLGSYGRASREIIAIVYDFDTVKERLEKLVVTTTTLQDTQPTPPPGGTGNATTTTSSTLEPAKKAPGRPAIIYWYEE